LLKSEKKRRKSAALQKNKADNKYNKK